MALNCELLTVDPLLRNWYEQREFSPLVNARTHQLGANRKILNARIHQQYEKLVQILGHRSQLDSYNHLVVTYYLLLQDRIEPAMKHFDKVESKNVVQSMPYAYCDAYLDLYREKPGQALKKAKKWVDYPVDRWRKKFENVVAMVEEIQNGSAPMVDEKDRAQQQDQLAAKRLVSTSGLNPRVKSEGPVKGSSIGGISIS